MNVTGRKTVKGRTSAPKTAKATATMVETSTSVPTHDEIERRSYELYLARGSAPGYELEDWLTAERELLSS